MKKGKMKKAPHRPKPDVTANAIDQSSAANNSASNASASPSALEQIPINEEPSPTKHIDMRYHFIKHHVEKGTIELYFVPTDIQIADIFTKALDEKRFKFLLYKLGMMNLKT